MDFPGVKDFIKRYQVKAIPEGADPLGFYLPPFAYAAMQILGQAVEATKSLDQDKLAEYMHANTFHTVFGDIKFGKDGEWEKGRMLMVQFQGITGNDLEQFKDPKHTVILDPPALKSGNVIYPFTGG
jgi:branched-chain amino acid transport system substrate-binding protein